MNYRSPIDIPGFQAASNTLGANVGPANFVQSVGGWPPPQIIDALKKRYGPKDDQNWMMARDKFGWSSATVGPEGAMPVYLQVPVGTPRDMRHDGPNTSVRGVNGFFTDLFGGILGGVVKTIAQQTAVQVKLRSGYKTATPDTVTIGGKSYVRLINPSNRTVYIDEMGLETDSPSGGGVQTTTASGQNSTAFTPLAIAAGAVALYLILRKR